MTSSEQHQPVAAALFNSRHQLQQTTVAFVVILHLEVQAKGQHARNHSTQLCMPGKWPAKCVTEEYGMNARVCITESSNIFALTNS